MDVLPTCISVSMCVPCGRRGQKRALDLLGLELEIVVGYPLVLGTCVEEEAVHEAISHGVISPLDPTPPIS